MCRGNISLVIINGTVLQYHKTPKIAAIEDDVEAAAAILGDYTNS
jgi:hypothetical protein